MVVIFVMAYKWWHGTLTDRRQAQVDDFKSFAHHLGERMDAEAGLGECVCALAAGRGSLRRAPGRVGTREQRWRPHLPMRAAAHPAFLHLAWLLADGKSQGSGSDRELDLEAAHGKPGGVPKVDSALVAPPSPDTALKPAPGSGDGSDDAGTSTAEDPASNSVGDSADSLEKGEEAGLAEPQQAQWQQQAPPPAA